MLLGSDEYVSVTEKVLGTWTITEYIASKKPVLGDTFEKAILNLDSDTWIASIELFLSKDILASKLKDWEQEFPGIVVDEYKIVSIARWKVDEKGETIFFSAEESNIEINGSGNNFEGFYGLERTKFEAAKSVKSADLGGGLAGFAAKALLSKATEKITQTEDYFVQPDFAIGYWINDLSPEGFNLDNKAGGKFTVVK